MQRETGDNGSLKKHIQTLNDLEHWKTCPGYKDLLSFLRQINEFAKAQHNAFYDPSTINLLKLVKTVKLLNSLSELVDEVKPFEDKSQRFGNKAFRVWFERMQQKLDDFFEEGFSADNAKELRVYLQDSFGNKVRIDYGTGHELSFIIFCLGLYKLELVSENETKDSLRNISHQILTLFAAIYMPLCRKIQLTYRLEPAGSHGVYSLDDFQFLPFVFGSAQLVRHRELEPQNFYEPEVYNPIAEKFMFYAAIQFINKVKTGPFYEHSNQLYNISGVDSWEKINRGLFLKYCDEVLHKLPVLQHISFGEKIMKWQ